MFRTDARQVARSAGTPLALCGVVLVLICAGATPGLAITRTCSTVSELTTAMTSYNGGDVIVITPGTYTLPASGYYLNRGPVTVRGSTGNRDDVILYGGGVNNPGATQQAIQLAGNDQTIRDLTISGVYMHAIHFQVGIYRPIVSNVHTLNCGEQHLKGAKYNYDGIIQNCLMENTVQRDNAHPEIRPNDYLGGIDLHGAVNFQIRDNVVRHIHGMNDNGDGLIFLWNDSQNNVIERNVTFDGAKGIELGNAGGSGQGAYNCSTTIVRNNFVVRETGSDVGMEFWYTKNCSVYDNTIYSVSQDNDWSRTLSIGDNSTYPTIGLDIAYNIIRGKISDTTVGHNGFALTGNLVDTVPQPNWFADPADLDLHLTSAAAAAIGTGRMLLDASLDVDGQLRGPHPDVGADQRVLWLIGDATADGSVDVGDLSVLAGHYRRTSGQYWTDGDFNGDGAVDASDLSILAGNYRKTSGGALAGDAPVPEPATLALLALGGLAMIRRLKT